MKAVGWVTGKSGNVGLAGIVVSAIAITAFPPPPPRAPQNGNITELLLKEGFARCVDWSIAVYTRGAEKLRTAERYLLSRFLVSLLCQRKVGALKGLVVCLASSVATTRWRSGPRY